MPVTSVECGDSAFGVFLPESERGLFHHDNTSQGIRTVPYSVRAFYDQNITAFVYIYFGGMVCRPLLPRLARTVIDDQDAVAMHSMNDGFGYCCSCAERTDTTDPFQQCGKRTACRTMDFGGRDPVTYGSCRYSRTPCGDDDFFQMLYRKCDRNSISLCSRMLVQRLCV